MSLNNKYLHCGTAWVEDCNSAHSNLCPECSSEVEPFKSTENGAEEVYNSAPIIKLLTALDKYSWDRFLVSYDEILSGIETFGDLIKKEAEQAGYIAQYAEENLHEFSANLFYLLTWKAFKWGLEDYEPNGCWSDKFDMKTDPFCE